MQMYTNLLQAVRNNQKSTKDLAILMKRFILTVDRTVAPEMQKVQFTDKKVAKMLTSLQNTVVKAEG